MNCVKLYAGKIQSDNPPAGTFKAIRLDFRTRPSPPHVLQGVKRSPAPSQSGHWMTCWKLPNGVLTGWTSWPEPPQVEHVLARVPAFWPSPLHVRHVSKRLTSSSLLQTSCNGLRIQHMSLNNSLGVHEDILYSDRRHSRDRCGHDNLLCSWKF